MAAIGPTLAATQAPSCPGCNCFFAVMEGGREEGRLAKESIRASLGEVLVVKALYKSRDSHCWEAVTVRNLLQYIAMVYIVAHYIVAIVTYLLKNSDMSLHIYFMNQFLHAMNPNENVSLCKCTSIILCLYSLSK